MVHPVTRSTVDIIRITWDGKIVNMVVGDKIFEIAAILREIFGDMHIDVLFKQPIPVRSVEEHTIAIMLYQQVKGVMRERQQIACKEFEENLINDQS